MDQSTIVEATYENGVLIPTIPLDLDEKQVVRVRVNPEFDTAHPYITKTANICGGRSVIRGTRIPVKVLVNHYHTQQNIDEILSGFPQLNLAQFYAALSYYYDHQAEIEAEIEADNLSTLLKQFNLEVDSHGVMSAKK